MQNVWEGVPQDAGCMQIDSGRCRVDGDCSGECRVDGRDCERCRVCVVKGF